jgi:RsmE family RNA methyltransferase
LAEVLKDTRIVSNSSAIVFDPSGRKFTEDDFTIGKGGEGKHKDDTVAVFIGPEGGWSSEELELFKKVGLPILSLGPQVLRTETAVVAVLSRLVF